MKKRTEGVAQQAGKDHDDDEGTIGNNKNCNQKRRSNNPNPKPRQILLPPPPPLQQQLRVAPLTLATLVRPLLVQCFGYLDDESLRQACSVSKEFEDIVQHDPLMEIKVIPLLEIRPDKNNNDDHRRFDRLFENLQRHRDKLQCYRKVKIIDGHKFQYYDRGKIINILKILKLSCVVSLDMSSSTSERSSISYCNYFAKILPNLQAIDLSKNEAHPTILRVFSQKCPRLEKITWNNTNKPVWLANIDGNDLIQATNLKELYMDNAVFCAGGRENKYLDLENDENSHIYLFYKCGSKVLERISIKNLRYYRYTHSGNVPVAQNALIKFIRHAPPSLRWFRSDLTQENIGMLRSERPNIEFVH